MGQMGLVGWISNDDRSRVDAMDILRLFAPRFQPKVASLLILLGR